jgi:DNA polymerase
VVPWSNTPKDAIMFWGEDDNHRWCQQDTYGGKLVENCTQAVARDLMAEAMLRVDAAGLPIVMSVHDELVCEVPEDQADPQKLCDLMSILPPWAKGLPVTAAGWAGSFYRK